MMDVKEIEKQAKEELKEERFREAVELAKGKLRDRKGLLERFFPFKIIIVRR